MRLLSSIAAATALAIGLSGAHAADEKPLNWGLLAVESQDNLLKRWGPLIEAVEAKMGTKIKSVLRKL